MEYYKYLTYVFQHKRFCENHYLNLADFTKRNRGETDLHTTSDVNYAKQLLKCCIKVDETNNFKETPLHAAVVRKDLPMVKLLLQKNANPNFRDVKNQTPLQLAIELCNNDLLNTTIAIKISEMLIKYTVFQSSLRQDFSGAFLNIHCKHPTVLFCLQHCLKEIAWLKAGIVYPEITLYNFVSKSLYQSTLFPDDVKREVFKKTLQLLTEKDFRFYNEQIATAFGKDFLISTLKAVHSRLDSDVLNERKMKTMLTFEDAVRISHYLGEVDLLNLFLAFTGTKIIF